MARLERLRSVMRLLRRLWDLVPLTFAGIGAAGAAVFAIWHFGKGQSDYVLHSAGIVALAIAGASVGFVALASVVLALSLRRSVRAARGEEDVVTATAGLDLHTGFRFPRFVAWPLVQVTMTWDEPVNVAVRAGMAGRFHEEVVVPAERGRIRFIRRRFVVRDILGLARVSFSMLWPARLHISPARTFSTVAITLRDVTGEGYSHPAGAPQGEMIEMRRYAPGDPLRFVLWKTYARTRRLLVRMPERAIAPQKSTVAYFVAGEGDEPSASTARTFVEEGLLGDELLFSADGAHENVRTPDEVTEQLVDSVAYRAQGGQGLGRLLVEIDPVQLGNCILFVPPVQGPWLGHVAAFSRMLPAPPTLVVAVDDIPEPARRSRLARLLSASEPVPRNGPSPLPALYDALKAVGSSVRVFHRPSGRLVTAGEMEALRGS